MTERTRRDLGRSSRDDDRGSRGGRDRDDSRTSRSSRDDDSGGRSSGRRGGGGFVYRERDPEAARRRSESNGRDFDSFLDQSVKMYKVHDGDNTVRILPPTWEGAEHWALDVHVHYQIGNDKDSYLCLQKMKDEPCPICEERQRANRAGDEEYAKELAPSKRSLMYVVDRNNEKEGIMVWPAPLTVDTGLLQVCIDKRSGELLPIDHPEDGYDVDFRKAGKALTTKYTGISVARRSSELGNDEALDFAVAHPLPTILKYYSYEHIAKAFGGGGSTRDRVDERKSGRDEPPEREARGGRDDKPSRGRDRDEPKEPEFTWKSIHVMNYDELCDVVDSQRLDIDPDKSKDDEDLATWICEELKIKDEPEPERGRDRGGRGDDAAEDRLSRMRRGRE